MDIRIDSHTLERSIERGTNEEEIRKVVETGTTVPAKHGRFGKAKVFEFAQNRLGKYYEQKKVEVIYIIDQNTIITVIVYVFCGKLE